MRHATALGIGFSLMLVAACMGPAAAPTQAEKAPTEARAWVDPNGITHFSDTGAQFVTGVYDTTGYSNTPQAWRNGLQAIAAAPMDVIVNYMISNAPPRSIQAYSDAMKPFGLHLLLAVNNFYVTDRFFPKRNPCAAISSSDDDMIACYAQSNISISQVAGYYVADEPDEIHRDPDVFKKVLHQHSIIRENDPGSITFLVLRDIMATHTPFREQVARWKNSATVIGVDPYPIRRSPPPQGLAQVGDWTKDAVDACGGNHPVWTVVQFFPWGADWPTRQQIRDMSWMAVTEGAKGVLYWSFGMRGLATVHDPAQKAEFYGRVVDTVKEIKGMQKALISPDQKFLSGDPSNSDIRVKQKVFDGERILISYNHSAAPATAAFKLAAPASQLVPIARTPGPTQSLGGKGFTISYAAFEARIYKIK